MARGENATAERLNAGPLADELTVHPVRRSGRQRDNDPQSPGGKSGNNAIHETHYNRLLTRLLELVVPVFASVYGPAVGAGCLLPDGPGSVGAAQSTDGF